MNERDLLLIKKFSALTGINESTLRHYDNIGLFQPLLRGENGYRYYSLPQTIAVNLVTVLSSLKIPLNEIGEVNKKRTPQLIFELLRQQAQELDQELSRLHQAYSVIHTYCEIIQEGLLADDQDINVLWMRERTIELGPVNDFSSGYFYDSFFAFIDQMSGRRVDSAYPVGGFYKDANTFLTAPGKPTRFFSLTSAGQDVKKAGEYLVGYARGYYGNVGNLPQRMQAYAKEHGLIFSGPVYEIYLHDEISISDPDQYLIQVSIPVKRPRK